MSLHYSQDNYLKVFQSMGVLRQHMRISNYIQIQRNTFKSLTLPFDRSVNKVSGKLSGYLEHTSSDRVLLPDLQLQITLFFLLFLWYCWFSQQRIIELHCIALYKWCVFTNRRQDLMWELDCSFRGTNGQCLVTSEIL